LEKREFLQVRNSDEYTEDEPAEFGEKTSDLTDAHSVVFAELRLDGPLPHFTLVPDVKQRMNQWNALYHTRFWAKVKINHTH